MSPSAFLEHFNVVIMALMSVLLFAKYFCFRVPYNKSIGEGIGNSLGMDRLIQSG